MVEKTNKGLSGLVESFAQGDPNFEYGDVLPIKREKETGDISPSAPNIVRGLVGELAKAIDMPGRAVRGERISPGEAALFGLAFTGSSALVPKPSGAITMGIGKSPIQEITSAKTSRKQIPSIFKNKNFDIKEGETNIDIGGGKYDLATDLLKKEKGAKNLVYDKFNRTDEHNTKVLSEISKKPADTATVANVLNVIKEPEIRKEVITQAKNFTKPDGKAYFITHDRSGKGTGIGEVTKDGYQTNMAIEDYIPEIENVFGKGNVEKKGKMLIAKKTNEIKLIEDKKLREQEAITRQMKREQMLDQLDDKYGYVDPEDYITGGLHPYETLDGKSLEKYLEYLDSSIVPGSKKDLIDPKLEPFGKGGKESIVYESVPSKGKGSEYQRAERIIVRQYEGTSPKTGKPMYTQKTFIPNRTFVKDIASYFGYKKGGSIIASNPYGNYEPRGI